ncbi:MAG: helicase C-terminal domain-containing protein [Capsulimonas sp.]|jgi:ATP-dependent DNA helicase DinG|uniref:ATP-dependent DNA helicase n=1 Tax=Capsulimonas sp. TaxID=2494211 RepID=UPI0032639862|nr:Rad3-related helicase [Capsulimonas sp.]
MSSKIDSFFAKNGLLAKALPGFSVRPQQQTVATAVLQSMRKRGGVSLIEAATGVGKTLSYLIPAVSMATPERKVVISTQTLALQNQLLEKDIPFLQSIWPTPFEAAVLKGRGNYLCLQDYDVCRGELWTAGDPQFIQIGKWSGTTETGDVAELDFTYPGWMDIRANVDTCKGQECRFFDRCFYYNMKREAQDASILVVNHALFFSDLAVRGRGEQNANLLPDYHYVIFDEAHHLETAAAGAFGVAFSSSRLPSLIDKVKRASRRLDLDQERLKALEASSLELFSPFAGINKPDFNVGEALEGPHALKNAQTQVAGVGALLDRLALELLKQDTSGDPVMKDRIDGLRRQCTRAKEELAMIFQGEDENYLRWGSQNRGGRRGPITTLHYTPISVAPLLGPTLWAHNRRVGATLISATLSTNGSFEYLRERLGIPPEDTKVTETLVDSTFDYAANTLVYIPRRLPPPSEAPGYAYEVVEEIIRLLDASKGGAFLLFTSHRALNVVHEQLLGANLPYPLLRQGEMPNARLVEAFKSQENAVLLGAQSFWEGVDIPGHGLRLVIIDRIPFAMPDSPLHKARVDQITAEGGDWFNDYALPQAQLRLKQGFGRLMRGVGDRGVVALLDTRLVTKRYGSDIMKFLPHSPVTRFMEDVTRFYTPETEAQPSEKLPL